MKQQYVQYIHYRSVLNAGHTLIKTMCNIKKSSANTSRKRSGLQMLYLQRNQ